MKIRHYFIFLCSFLFSYSISHAEVYFQGLKLQCSGDGYSKQWSELHFEGTVFLKFVGCDSGSSMNLSLKVTESHNAFNRNYNYGYMYHPAIGCQDSIHSAFMYGANLNSVGATIHSELKDDQFLDRIRKEETVKLAISFYSGDERDTFHTKLLCEPSHPGSTQFESIRGP